MNPWNLTPRQAATMDALVEHGHRKVVAARMGMALGTIDGHLKDIRARMKTPHTVTMAVQWDRFRRGATA